MPLKTFMENFIQKFIRDETTTLAASLAFYTALSLAPLVILFVTISSKFSLGLQNSFINEAGMIVGPDGAAAMEMIISSAKTRPDLTSLASLVGVATLLFSAGLIFGELRAALNRIFNAQVAPPAHSGAFFTIWNVIKGQLIHICLALCFIFLIIVSLIASSVISATTDMELRPWAAAVNVVMSFISYIALFTVTFRYLPDRRQPWRQALRGGVLTALLFVVGKEGLALYLGHSALASAYGAAGSLIVLLVWVYYSTLITFIGAQVSSILRKS